MTESDEPQWGSWRISLWGTKTIDPALAKKLRDDSTEGLKALGVRARAFESDVESLANEMRDKPGFVRLLDEGQSLWFAGETTAQQLGLVVKARWKTVPDFPHCAWELTALGREVAQHLRSKQ